MYEDTIECRETSLITVIGGVTTLHEPQITMKKSRIGITVLDVNRQQIAINLQLSSEPDFKAHHTFTVEIPDNDMFRLDSFMAGAFRNLNIDGSGAREMNFYVREDPNTSDNGAKTISILQWD